MYGNAFQTTINPESLNASGHTKIDSTAIMDNLDFGLLASSQNFGKKSSSDTENTQLKPELRNIISKMMLSRNRDNLYELMDYMVQEKEKMPGFQMTHDEAMELDAFISKFTILKQN